MAWSAARVFCLSIERDLTYTVDEAEGREAAHHRELGATWSPGDLYPATVARVQDAVLPTGLGLGLLLLLIGLVQGNFGLAGLGVVVALAAYYGRRDD